MIKVSIITVSFNSETTIERTIMSVLNQTYNCFEYIIIDGASKDSTIKIVKSYEQQFEGKMKWISESDSGIYDAMNKGIKMATGEIVGIVNSDDWLEPNALEVVVNGFNSNGKNVNTLYCGGIYFHRRDGDVRRLHVNLESFYKHTKLYIMKGLRHPAIFVPLEVYKNIGLYNPEMKISADQDFVLRCFYRDIKFFDLHEIISNMSEGGVSTTVSKRVIEMVKEDRKKMLCGFSKKGISYLWLYYSWRLRGLLKRVVLKVKLYKLK